VEFSTGFSDVDASARASELAEYLGRAARHMAAMRNADYERLQVERGQAVLDVGCGAGEVCIELADRLGPAGRVCGVDVSEAMVAAARAAAEKAGRQVDLRVATAYSLPFDDASFDAVRSERVFQHLDDPATALAEMVRVTRPGGRILVVDPDHSQHAISLETDLQCRVHEATRSALLRMIVNPRIGTRLSGLFRQAGLSGIAQFGLVLPMTFPDYAQTTFLQDRLAHAVAAGDITEEESREFLAGLDAQHALGTFFSGLVGYSVIGVKP
jgi:ubiquinone/menaquinone biosynthesis C-methylase UbiE